jgi:Flp pilus assembly protein TadD
MLDCQMFGLDAGGHHLTNLLFHILNTLLLFIVLRRMTDAMWRSAFVAALFALHPLHVESVAWVAERKDVLSAFFWLLTMWAYTRYVESPGLGRYLSALVSFALGLMAKPMLVTLPFVLLLLDYWPLGRLQRFQLGDHQNQRTQAFHLFWEKMPFFALAAVSSTVTFLVQKSAGSVGSLETFPPQVRIANALVAYVSYLGRMIWPQDLAVLYPHSNLLPGWQVTGACLLLLSISLASIISCRRHAYFFVGWFWYIGTLVPVIGLVQVGLQSMADRYTYLPLIGIFMAITWGVGGLVTRWRSRTPLVAACAAACLLALMMGSWLQVRHWQNSTSLFKQAFNRPGSQEEFRQAVTRHTEALRTNSDYVSRDQDSKAHLRRGFALSKLGRRQEAVDHFTKALIIDPDSSSAHQKLGVVLAELGNFQEAIAHFTEVLRIEPDHAEAHYNLGVVLAKQGNLPQAMGHYSEALEVKGDYWEAHVNLGILLARQGNLEEASAHFIEVLRIKPDYAEAHYNLGVALAQRGQPEDAIRCFSKALQIKPDYSDARHMLMAIRRAQKQETTPTAPADR